MHTTHITQTYPIEFDFVDGLPVLKFNGLVLNLEQVVQLRDSLNESVKYMNAQTMEETMRRAGVAKITQKARYAPLWSKHHPDHPEYKPTKSLRLLKQ